jgi:mannobiose 2-epimerase
MTMSSSYLLAQKLPLPTSETLDSDRAELLTAEIGNALRQVLQVWFPRCVDAEYGGFLCDFDYKWRPSGSQVKMLEYQARMARLLARATATAGFECYRPLAAHAFKYLRDILWDRQYGGWYRMLDRAGQPLEASTKHGHGIAYAIGACAAYYELTSEVEALELAKAGFAWIEKVAHDHRHGGYFASYQRDGTRIDSIERNPTHYELRDCIGTPFGYKDANTNADFLETWTDLYRIWPDPLVRERLQEMFHIVRDRMVVPPGSVHMYFLPDWTPVPDFCRYGYGLNVSNILAKASRTPGLGSDSTTAQVIKSIIDTLLRYSWDRSKSGFFHAGSTFGPTPMEDIVVLVRDKFWWPQAEATRALLRAALLYPGDPMDYMLRFNELWSYIANYLIDRKHGGWLLVGRDVSPRRRRPAKAGPWKEPSHEVHSLLECIHLLKSQPAQL